VEDLLQTKNYNDPEEVFLSIDFGCYGKQQAYSCIWKRPLFLFIINIISINSFLFCCRTERKKATSDRDVAFQSVVVDGAPTIAPPRHRLHGVRPYFNLLRPKLFPDLS